MAAVAFESAQLVLALILLFFLPGWTLINALFPRKGDLDREYDVLYRITLGIVMSVVVVILFGFGLNSLSSPLSDVGYVTSANLWGGLTCIPLAFSPAGWWRGAYPIMGPRHPRLARSPPH